LILFFVEYENWVAKIIVKDQIDSSLYLLTPT